ncbi:glycine decarboxylase [Salix suchowensis]|nr:glycine decarboxylase [Salix suchowensis]
MANAKLCVAEAISSLFAPLDTFPDRHIGPDDHETSQMLSALGYDSFDAFIADTVPQQIRVENTVTNGTIPPLSESELHRRAKALGGQNDKFKSYIGMGYHNAVVPPVILRNVSISSFVCEYITYSAKVMENPQWYTPYTPYQPEVAQGRLESLVNFQTMVMSLTSMDIANASLLDEATAAAEGMVMAYTRAKGFGINIVTGSIDRVLSDDALRANLCGVLVQYPDVNGTVKDLGALTESVHSVGGLVVCATDLLALTMLKPPGEWGADIVLEIQLVLVFLQVMGSPCGLLCVNLKAYHVIVSSAREQHIRREKATSNIVRRIAERVHALTQVLKMAVESYGYKSINNEFFDTLTLDVSAVTDDSHVGVTLDESVGPIDIMALINVFASAASLPRLKGQMMRYIEHLASKDIGLVHSMIPLGSCTMKLNSTSSMIPLTWPEFSNVHPFAPADQVKGYLTVIKVRTRGRSLQITGFHSASLQPNSGAAGEYAGLCGHRNICLIPLSAHGTNPASAVMAGLKVVPVKALANGNLDLEDLKAKAEKHKDDLAAFMITYPSTFGVFEEGVQTVCFSLTSLPVVNHSMKACQIIHDNGGQVYLDGANLNAQIGSTNPAICGGDVCHMNLHKTFAIPHGGGGPGVGPICVAEHLAPFFKAINAVSAAPFGSSSIHLISWAYIKMLGGQGLADSSRVALLNANYMAHRLAAGLKVTDFAKRLQVGPIERITRLSELISLIQDYGFHPPTCSWPISTCMLIEPTESETLEEIDRYILRFCDAMIQIRQEAEDIITGKMPKDNNLLKNAPHPVGYICQHVSCYFLMCDTHRPYSRQDAAYPAPWLLEKKFWPTVSRVDDAYGDLNLIVSTAFGRRFLVSDASTP